ncbi:MAG: PQQ-binding-like beta-propeller repeat protein [Planctomycetales bacterium]
MRNWSRSAACFAFYALFLAWMPGRAPQGLPLRADEPVPAATKPAATTTPEPVADADAATQPAPAATVEPEQPPQPDAAADAAADEAEGEAPKQPANVRPNPLGRLFRDLIGGRTTPSERTRTREGFGPGRYALRDDIDARTPQDPAHTKRLRQAAELVDDGDWESAERTIRYLLDLPEGPLVRDEQGRWVSLHAEASRLLRKFPDEKLAAYRRKHGATADGALREARRDGSAARLGEVVRRYFHTDAGYAAANELGSRHFDRGEFGVAARWFARLIEADAAATREPAWRMKAAFALRRAGDAAEAERLIESLVRDQRQPVEIGGERVDPRAWLANAAPPAELKNPVLDEWRMPYGNASRTAVAAGGDPLLLPRWTQPLTGNTSIAERIDSLHLDLADAGQPGIPTMLPLLVDGKLIYRTLRGVRVDEAATGRPLWETQAAWSPEELLGGPLAQQLAQLGMVSFDQYSGGEQHPLARMLLDDGVSGLLSSDGRRAFLVEDQAHSLQSQIYSRWGGRWGGWGGGWNENEEDPLFRSFATNRLTAYDLGTGRPAWSGGGPLTDELFEVPLAGNYFFGPPAIDGRRAYVIGQKDERIVLYALDAATGLVEWSAWIGFSDTKIAEDFPRRSWTAQPAVARGVVVCPTTTGWLVAVDAASREVLWAQRFSKPNPSQNPEDPERRMVEVTPLNSRWQPAAPVIAGDAVIFTPPEEQSIFCFDLYDGAVRWSQPRGEHLYLAGVFDDRVLLVAGSRVSALSSKTGRALWTVTVPPDAGRVSGRGVATAERYYLPLDSGQLWSIDLATGKVADRWFLPEGSSRLENLGLYQGMLLSVGTRGATAFEQRAAIEREIRELTARNPRDPHALLKQAEIQRLERNYAAAIAALREVPAETVPAALRARYRAAMSDTLSALVRAAPAERGAELDELARFAESPEEKLQAERLRGLHLAARDEHEAAFELYARLADAGGERLVPRDDDSRVVLRADLWSAGRLADAWDHLGDAPRAAWDARIREQAEQLRGAPRGAQESFVLRYGFHPAALAVRLHLADSAADEGDFARAAHELLALSRTEDEPVAAAALARLARLMADAGAPHDAEHFRRLRADRFPQSPPAGPPSPPSPPPLPRAADDGAFGPLAPLRRQSPSAHGRDLAPAPDWGDFDLRLLRSGEQSYSNISYELAPDAFPTPFFRRHRFELHMAQQQLAIVDRLDESLHWLVPLRSIDNSRQQRARCWVAGLRFVVLHGQVLHVLSPLDRRVLWTRHVPLAANELNQLEMHGYHSWEGPAMQEGLGIVGQRGLLNRPAALGPVPVVNSDYLALRNRRELTVLDADAGRVRWRIGGLANGTRVLGNEQVLFIVPPDGNPTALRARDGERLEVAGLDQILGFALAATPDGLVLIEPQAPARLLNFGGTQTVVRLHDPLAGRDLWKHTFAGNNPYLDLLDDGSLAAVDSAGNFEVLALDGGQTQRFEKVLARQDRLARESVIVAADDERIFLLVNRGRRDGGGYSDGVPHATANGAVIALDRATGQVAWRRTVDRQSLMLPYFRHMPVLVFAVRRFERSDEIHLMIGEVLAVDRRTGRTLLESSLPGSNGFQSLSVNARDRYVELGSYNERLRFTAVPRQQPRDEGNAGK